MEENNLYEFLENETDEILIAIRDALKGADKILEEIKEENKKNG